MFVTPGRLHTGRHIFWNMYYIINMAGPRQKVKHLSAIVILFEHLGSLQTLPREENLLIFTSIWQHLLIFEVPSGAARRAELIDFY